MSDVKTTHVISRPPLLRRSARLLMKCLGAESTEAVEELEPVVEEKNQQEEMSYIQMSPLSGPICDLDTDSEVEVEVEVEVEEEEQKIEEPPITTTPRRKVGRIRPFNMTACMEACERAQQQTRLMGLYEAVTNELIRLGVREKRFLTVEDVIKCFGSRDLPIH